MYMYYDFTGYGLVIIGAIITLASQIYLNNRYNKYSKINCKSNISGVEVARKILDANCLSDVHVTEVKGILSDHYDPRRKVVRLSKNIFHETTIAAISVAAHECGHAIQHKDQRTNLMK